jgi:hypothetical protein
MPQDPDANEARNTLLQIVTAARNGDMQLAARLTNEYKVIHGDILPMFISSVSLIETVLLTMANELSLDADKLFHGICLGLSVKQIEEQMNQQTEE